jgi:predicted ATP-dependent Lon-type protease
MASFAMVTSLAIELRQRVHNQLAVLAAGEFAPKSIAFRAWRRWPLRT